MTTRTPEWLVERLHQGDLSPAEAAAVRARLSKEGGLPRLDALARDDARFAEAHPAAPAVAEIRRRAAERAAPRPRPRRIFLVAAPLAAAAAVAVVALRLPWPALRGADDDVRPKGSSPHLAIHRQAAGGEPEALARDARARAGDVLQLSVVSGGRPYGVVVSVDGRGVVTRHGPGDGALAAKLPSRGAVPLDHSYRLDDAPAFERFFLVTGGSPFAVEPVLDAFRRLAAEGRARAGAPALPAGLAWSDFVLEKGP
jgi:hypothetical protein